MDGTEQEIVGEVRFIAAALDTATRTLMIEVVVENADGAVRAGSVVWVVVSVMGHLLV